jgi:hypothetical protein
VQFGIEGFGTCKREVTAAKKAPAARELRRISVLKKMEKPRPRGLGWRIAAELRTMPQIRRTHDL